MHARTEYVVLPYLETNFTLRGGEPDPKLDKDLRCRAIAFELVLLTAKQTAENF